MAPFAADLALALRGTSFVCPTARLMKITCRDGAEHHAWVRFASALHS